MQMDLHAGQLLTAKQIDFTRCRSEPAFFADTHLLEQVPDGCCC